MQISQLPTDFSPISLKLETREEAEALWEAINVGINYSENLSDEQRKFLNRVSNWFSNEAKL